MVKDKVTDPLMVDFFKRKRKRVRSCLQQNVYVVIASYRMVPRLVYNVYNSCTAVVTIH